MKIKILMISFALSLPLIPISAQVMDSDSKLGTDVSKGKHEQHQGDSQDPSIGVGQDARQEEEAMGTSRQEEQSASGKVIDSKTESVKHEAGKLNDKDVKQGSANVEYKTKEKVTKTIQKQAQIPTVQICQTKADINGMKLEDFQALGFDRGSAEKIIQQRAQKGQFASVDELSKVEGLSQSTYNRLKDQLGVLQSEEKQAEEARE
ncbi:MAG TPA: helix-hairpin-helix domain-containing protein [Bacteriovoracaceae bacterium]|nr:helix-hairpin-helix domain-containing protein [Bacteriovoracaceae bacterium]